MIPRLLLSDDVAVLVFLDVNTELYIFAPCFPRLDDNNTKPVGLGRGGCCLAYALTRCHGDAGFVVAAAAVFAVVWKVYLGGRRVCRGIPR